MSIFRSLGIGGGAMEIIKYPNKVLSTISIEATFEEAKDIVEKLQDAINNLKWGKCAGLAAPQIGINKRVFIGMGKAYINPQITFQSPMTFISKEGCYSLQDRKFDYPKTRHQCIKMKYMDIKGKIKENIYTGLNAVIMQHEIDHLEGKLCCE